MSRFATSGLVSEQLPHIRCTCGRPIHKESAIFRRMHEMAMERRVPDAGNVAMQMTKLQLIINTESEEGALAILNEKIEQFLSQGDSKPDAVIKALEQSFQEHVHRNSCCLMHMVNDAKVTFAETDPTQEPEGFDSIATAEAAVRNEETSDAYSNFLARINFIPRDQFEGTDEEYAEFIREIGYRPRIVRFSTYSTIPSEVDPAGLVNEKDVERYFITSDGPIGPDGKLRRIQRIIHAR